MTAGSASVLLGREGLPRGEYACRMIPVTAMQQSIHHIPAHVDCGFIYFLILSAIELFYYYYHMVVRAMNYHTITFSVLARDRP